MSKVRFLTTPTRVEDFLADYTADKIDNDKLDNEWQYKAERLQARRWKKLRAQLGRD